MRPDLRDEYSLSEQVSEFSGIDLVWPADHCSSQVEEVFSVGFRSELIEFKVIIQLSVFKCCKEHPEYSCSSVRIPWNAMCWGSWWPFDPKYFWLKLMLPPFSALVCIRWISNVYLEQILLFFRVDLFFCIKVAVFQGYTFILKPLLSHCNDLL